MKLERPIRSPERAATPGAQVVVLEVWPPLRPGAAPRAENRGSIAREPSEGAAERTITRSDDHR
jgi:hypothetical protein